jgi:circadian clock protein KaiC
MKRERFGIKGFDGMIEGGIPSNSIVGLYGPPGVGKSIFALHYLLAGARKGQKSLYICLEEPRSNIDNMLTEFSWGDEFLDFEKKGLISVRCMNYIEYEKIFSDLFQRIGEDKKIGRLVIDSFNIFFLSAFGTATGYTELGTRRMINQAFTLLRRKGLSTVLVLEKHSETVLHQNIPYLVDGMVHLDFISLGTIERRVFVPKMRWTNQHRESKAYEIGKDGIRILEE